MPDFPKKGILFYDITTLLKDKDGFATLIDAMAERYRRTPEWIWSLASKRAASSSVRRWLIA